MTSLRENPATLVGIPMEDQSVAFEDRTARARIREAALEHFANEGYERPTIRAKTPKPPASLRDCSVTAVLRGVGHL